MGDLKERGIHAAKRVLTHKGCDVVSVDWENGMIAFFEGEVLVFAKVSTREGSEVGDVSWDGCTDSLRREFEGYAIRYLASEDVEVGTPIRFDSISMAALGSKAFMKHHVNCVG